MNDCRSIASHARSTLACSAAATIASIAALAANANIAIGCHASTLYGKACCHGNAAAGRATRSAITSRSSGAAQAIASIATATQGPIVIQTGINQIESAAADQI